MKYLIFLISLTSCKISSPNIIEENKWNTDIIMDAYLSANTPDDLYNKLSLLNINDRLSIKLRDKNQYEQIVTIFRDNNSDSFVQINESLFIMTRAIRGSLVQISFKGLNNFSNMVDSIVLDTSISDKFIGNMIYFANASDYKPKYLEDYYITYSESRVNGIYR
jgi:hypothetical protein